jgi:hypothetical protein
MTVVPDRPPDWRSAPDDETGASVPLRVVLFQDDMTAISVTGLVAYTTGFAFNLNVLRRVDDVLRLIEHLGRRPEASEKVVKLRIGYADGRRASNADHFDDGPEDIRLSSSGGGGGGTAYHARYWAWPLPPQGPLTFGVEWGSIALPFTEIEIDAQPIIDAAAQSERPWA